MKESIKNVFYGYMGLVQEAFEKEVKSEWYDFLDSTEGKKYGDHVEEAFNEFIEDFIEDLYVNDFLSHPYVALMLYSNGRNELIEQLENEDTIDETDGLYSLEALFEKAIKKEINNLI